MTRKLLVSFILFLMPLALHAQAPEGAQARMEAALEWAVEQGIPASLVQSKIAEGRAKGIPPGRIAQAAEQRASALVRARDALVRSGVEPRHQDLSVGADAIQGGVSEAALASIARRAPEDRRLVAIDVLRELVRMDVPVGDAVEVVAAALRRGPDALANLPAQAMEARDRRGPPAGRRGGEPTAGPPAGVPASGREAGERRGPPRGTRGGPPHL